MIARRGSLVALALLLPPSAGAAELRGVAELRADAGAIEEIKAKESLEVRAILVPAGSPAVRGRELVKLDTASLQRYLEEKQEELLGIQRSYRENPRGTYLGPLEADAAKEVANLQSRIAGAPVVAPADGYVVSHRVSAGGKSKRRKPVLSFVELSGTRLTVILEGETSPPATVGESLTVWSPDARARFLARLDAVEPTSGVATLLRLTPLELPFLLLDVDQDVALQRQGDDPPEAVATSIAGAGAPSGDASSGPSDGGLSERVDVEVVNVDAVVVDRGGNRVTELSRDDFEIEVDGSPIAIEYFSAPSRSAIPESPQASPADVVAVPPPPAAAGRLLVFVDESALEGRTSTELLERIEAFLLERERSGDELFVAAFTGILRPLYPGSDRPQTLRAALAELREIGGRGAVRARERARLEEDIRTSGVYGGMNREALQDEIRQFEDEEILRQRQMVATLGRWASSFGGVEGRKSLLLATSGLNAEPGAYLQELLGVVGGGAPGPAARSLAAGATTGMRLLDEVDDLLRTLHDARFVVYSVTPPESVVASNSAGHRSLGEGVARMAPRDRTDADSARNLARLADETGGASFVINAALDEKIGTIGADAAASYSLGFSTGPEDGYDEHRIRVSVRRPGLEVRSRTAFRRLDPGKQRENALVSAASLDVDQAAFGLELLAGEPAAAGKKGSTRRFPVTVRIPIGALFVVPAQDGASYEAKLEVRFAVSRANGELKLGETSPVTITIPAAELERAKLDFWAHRGEVEIGAGEARLGVLVTDLASGSWSTASLSLAGGATEDSR